MGQDVNPLNKNPRRSFSQFDEDGITLEILKRISVGSTPSFLEIGVGNGLENNTLLLAALGWKGSWIGNEDLDPNLNLQNRISFTKKHVDLDFIEKELEHILRESNVTSPTLISIDIDTLDYYFVESILNLNIRPSVFIVEYNGSFVPPLDFIREFDPLCRWQGDNNFGASLSAWDKLMNSFGYSLVACSLSGVNAFFVPIENKVKFLDVPSDIDALYNSPNYSLKISNGHPLSVSAINQMIKKWI